MNGAQEVEIVDFWTCGAKRGRSQAFISPKNTQHAAEAAAKQRSNGKVVVFCATCSADISKERKAKLSVYHIEE